MCHSSCYQASSPGLAVGAQIPSVEVPELGPLMYLFKFLLFVQLASEVGHFPYFTGSKMLKDTVWSNSARQQCKQEFMLKRVKNAPRVGRKVSRGATGGGGARDQQIGTHPGLSYPAIPPPPRAWNLDQAPLGLAPAN